MTPYTASPSEMAPAMLPARILLVWSREDFPFYARLAIESLLVNAPDVAVELHLVGRPPESSPHFRAILRRGLVATHVHPELPRGQSLQRFSLALLRERGGLLLDAGTLTTGPIRRFFDAGAVLSREWTSLPEEGPLPISRRIAGWLARLMWALCPVNMQPELERFGSFRWLQQRWLVPAVGRGLIGALPGAEWVSDFGLEGRRELPADCLIATTPFYQGSKPQARATSRQFDAASWPAMLRLFQRSGDRDELLLRAVGPRDVLENRNRNRFYRAAYGVMCANGLHRYAIRGRNHGFDTGVSDSGTPIALAEPVAESRS